MKASFRAAFALTLAAVAAPALAQTPVPPSQLGKPAAPPPVNIPGVSPAGNALLTKLQAQPDPLLLQLVQQQRALSGEILSAIAGATVDLPKFIALMKKREGLGAQINARADDRVIRAAQQLSPADRAPFLRGVTGGGQQRR